MPGETAVSEGLTEAGEFTSKRAHTQGCWQEASPPCHVDLTIWLPACLHDMAAGFPRASDPRERRAGICSVFYGLPLEVSHHYFCHVLYQLDVSH